MASIDLANNVRTMIGVRYKSHFESGDHVLREGSQHEIAYGTINYHHEIDPETGLIYTNGHIVAPGGLGKTISLVDIIIGINTLLNGRYVLGDPVLGKRTLITVPTNELAGQWEGRILGGINEETGLREPSIFGDQFSEDTVGVLRAGMSDKQREEVLFKPVVIAVHDTVRISYEHVDPQTQQHTPLLKPEDFDCVLIDEVDDKVRGDITGKFYKDVFFPHCLIIGCTATNVFRSGRTIGDYLFGGKKPICEITHWEAVKRREIAPHVNIIVEPEVDASSVIEPQTDLWGDYTEAQQLRFIEQTGTDQALLEAIRVGSHPLTEKPLRNMMQMHQAVNIEHAKHIAKELNDAFGPGYAEAVWGRTDEDMNDEIRRLAKWFLITGELKAIVQCKLLGRGTDIPPLEMTVQHAPTLSPNKVVQFHTRASRRHDGQKTAILLSPYLQGINQLVVGEVLGGLYMLPDGYEFPPTTGQRSTPSDPKPWPEIKGIKFHYTQRHMEMFANERRRQRYVDGLPAKTRHLLTLEEMAHVLGVEPSILNERVYAPLQEAYEKRQAREKFVDIESGQQGEFLHVHGKMFPVWRLGFYQHNRREVFCADENLVPLCEHTLYGRLDNVPPEMLNRGNAKRLLASDDTKISELWQTLQNVLFKRKPYERRVEINGVSFSHDNFGFYRNLEGASEFFLSPDALVPSYRYINAASQEVAARWAEQPLIRQCKTSSWLTKDDVIESLGLNPLLASGEIDAVNSIFYTIGRLSRNMRTGEEQAVEVYRRGHTHSYICSKRWLPLASTADQYAICIHKNSLEHVKRELGMESVYDAGGRAYRETYRPGDHPAP